ncbi:hypothetical protein IQ247_03625 [Plectonema cf. radiosum LEGE 06105]|uniref:Uncharacterized protein n=1 Tax=Plectonema cf. radiosum LEGE 06105 TaxID=945769 RepID=A0A8J7EZV3_9CYAN|nr:hypothetical protein [Plectonema radiosum]MBE9211815.1 hypothetical protein [Plectonema cf. radiosum LEGE 06105]
MKYFFLSEGWKVGRVWAFDGLWQVTAWRRQPDIQRLNICLVEDSEVMWLYQVEDAIVTVEVQPALSVPRNVPPQNIGQVVLKRLISAEQVIERLGNGSAKCQLQNIHSVVK